MKYNQVCHARKRRVLRWCAWVERGSQNEKVVSSVDTSTVTITILHQSPFRFAAATAGYVVAVGNGFLPRRAPIPDPQLTFTRHRRPVFHSFLYPRIYDFPRPVSTREWRQDLPVAKTTKAHTTIDRSGSSINSRRTRLISKRNRARLNRITLLRSPENSSHLEMLLYNRQRIAIYVFLNRNNSFLQTDYCYL